MFQMLKQFIHILCTWLPTFTVYSLYACLKKLQKVYLKIYQGVEQIFFATMYKIINIDWDKY
ncbi:hypothetical protein AKG09_05735 [Neisseria sp. 83E34]|nr:hypothetical protein AKG09_05735 [Neisseria sp. 83E34]